MAKRRKPNQLQWQARQHAKAGDPEPRGIQLWYRLGFARDVLSHVVGPSSLVYLTWPGRLALRGVITQRQLAAMLVVTDIYASPTEEDYKSLQACLGHKKVAELVHKLCVQGLPIGDAEVEAILPTIDAIATEFNIPRRPGRPPKPKPKLAIPITSALSASARASRRRASRPEN
jgi:hypothetical protein